MHCKYVSELPDELAGAVGQAVSKVAKALTKGKELLLKVARPAS